MRVIPRFGVLAVAVVLIGYGFLRLESQGPNGVQPVDRLTVVDAKGKRVGGVLGFKDSGLPMIALRIERRLVILGVSNIRFEETRFTLRFNEFRFESANCTGTPYLAGYGGFFDDDMAPQYVLHYTKLFAPDGDRRRVVIRSQGPAANVPGTSCRPDTGEWPDALPLRFVIDLANEFQPPFTLQ